MKYIIPIAACCIVGEYWIEGSAGVGVALILMAVFHWFGDMAQKEKEA